MRHGEIKESKQSPQLTFERYMFAKGHQVPFNILPTALANRHGGILKPAIGISARYPSDKSRAAVAGYLVQFFEFPDGVLT